MTEIPSFDFHHGGVSVPDLEDAISWYGDMLGFEVEKRFHIPPAKADAAMLKRGSLRFELFQAEGAKPLPDERRMPNSDLQTHGNKHVAFHVADLEGFISAMEAKKADIAYIVRADHGKAVFLRDCAGNLIEFVGE